ncbi:MAG: hypothetical protein LBC18_05445 [Opitutaceae bacterium]|jgi:hypothetical protein|nr:hypothetical protein [Opitutaceae bacterium]
MITLFLPRFTPRFPSLSLATALLLSPALLSAPLAAQQSPPPAPATEDATVLDKIVIEGADIEHSVLPIRPNSNFYGFDELVQNTPRSIFQVTTAQIAADHFHNFSDLARYSPSISRGTASNFSTFSKIRGGASDTTRNGVLLLPAAVRPFNNNYWEAVDIVAGIPSVIQGSTSRTAGVVNYVTKKPVFDGNHADVTVQIGRLGKEADTSYQQYTTQLDYNHVVDEKFAFRVSLQKTDAEQYWGNAGSDFYDIYAAATWKPFKNLTVDTNYNYTNAAGAMPYGINRLDQNLLDNWQYRSGLYIPQVNVGGTNYYASRAEPGKFAASKNGPYNIDAATIFTPGAPGSSKDNPAAISFVAPDHYTLVPIKGSQVLYTDRAFSDTREHLFQNITELKLNSHITLRNNSLFHYVHSYVYGNDGYQSYMINKMITSRFEFATDFEIGKSGSWLRRLGLRHQSNTGYEFRYLYNLCDMVEGNNVAGSNNFDATNPADGGGNLNYATLLGSPDANIYANPPVRAGASAVTPFQTGYGFWVNLPFADYYAAKGRYHGIGQTDTMLRVNDLYQNNLFTEQKLAVWKFILRAGARLTYINDFIKPLGSTDRAIDEGLITAYTKKNLRDHASENNYDLNGSISFLPFPWLTAYAAWDRDYASGDCYCCLTQGFSTLAADKRGLDRKQFHLKSTLREFGAKFEILPGKLFGSVAWFDQTRVNVTGPMFPFLPDGMINPRRYQGAEFALTYQPGNHFAAGINYGHITSRSLGMKMGAMSFPGGKEQEAGVPKDSGNAWAGYQFNNGLGVKASVWATSPWTVSGGVVRSQHNIDLGLFLASKKWRVDVDILNVTDEKNWAPSGSYAGDVTTYLLPAERLGLQAKITRRF